jgi:DNA adenine methylase
MPPPPFCYVGGKTSLKKIILPLIPPHKVYVEPFVGGGAIFFNKTPAERSIINDLSKELMIHYSLLKTKAPEDPSDYPNLTSKDSQEAHFKRGGGSPADRVVSYIIKKCGGFSGRDATNKIYKAVNYQRKLKHLKQYKERLKTTSLTSADYKIVVRAHDSPDTFFFLDPPYEGSKGLYKAFEMDYDAMAKLLKGIKGKFMVTINKSDAVKKAFDGHGFKFRTIFLKGRSTKGIGKRDREEYIITNY